MTIRSSYSKRKSGGGNQHGCLLGFGLLWTGFSGFFLILMLLNDPNILGLIFISVFVLVGLALIGYAAMGYYARFRMGKPNFVLSQTELRPGEKFGFSYQHTFPRSVTINWIKTQLIFRETATYQRGTDTTTVTHNHIMDEYEEPGATFHGGHMMSKNYNMQIPIDGMHTVKVRRNALEWIVKFEADIPSLPNFIEEFELTVFPEQPDHG